jgi:predicted Zn-dependent peptidase
MDLQAVWSQAAAFGLEALYKGKIESEKEYADRLRKVTKADVQKICRELYLDANQATVFVS